MRQDLTDLTLVIDRSGSMESVREDAEGGVNSFIDNQKSEDGECNLTLVQFDTEYEFIHNGVNIKDVGKFSLHPRGRTALLDAVGRAINETGERLSKLKEEDRPALVVFVIVTDGLENSSREFTLDKVRELIERQQNDYSWKFTYLGAGPEAFSQGMSLGVSKDAVAQYSQGKEREVFTSAGLNVSRMRHAVSCGMDAESAYTKDERESMA